MAVSQFTKSKLLNSTLGAFGAIGRAIAPVSMTRRILRDNAGLTGLNFPTAQAIARQAFNLWESGRTLNRRSVNPLTRQEHSIDPSIEAGDPRYRYRVLVQVREGSQVTASTVVVVNSDVILTRNAINQLALTLVDTTGTPNRADVSSAISAAPDTIPTTTILTAGRRP